MKKIYHLGLLSLFTFLFFSCNNDPVGFINPFENVDYEALAVEDDAALVKYLSTHYYNESLDSILPIENEETSLLNTNNLQTDIITTTIDGSDIEFKLYTFITEQGSGNNEYNTINNGQPTNIDSVLVTFSSRTLLKESISVVDGEEVTTGNVLSSTITQNSLKTWFATNVLGVSYGLTHFKPGVNTTIVGERISFDNVGKGFVFVPSGLAFPSTLFNPNDFNPPPYDQVLVYQIDLLDFVPNTDHDRDGVPSIQEDANCDNNPRNDFNDKFVPNLPDYLNSNSTVTRSCM